MLLCDGDELDDVAAVLRGLGVSFEHRRGPEAALPVPLPGDLLVAGARRAMALPPAPSGRMEPPGPSRVAISTADSPGLRTGLRDAGFNLLVRRPVHPTALRLLVLRLLYRGSERRRYPRVSVGVSTRYRPVLFWSRAILAELSAGGCRLLTPKIVAVGRRLRVEVPDPASPGARVRVRGRVVRANLVSPRDSTATVALQFLPMNAAVLQRLERIVAAYEPGPASMPGGWSLEEPYTPVPVDERREEPSEADPAAAGSPASERRGSPRSPYGARIVTLGEEAAHVVMGRDLSLGGLRIEPHGGLERGQRLSLALHGAGMSVPVVVRGTVQRDDGEAGLVIVFDAVPAAQGEALAKLLGGLGGIEALGASGAGQESVVTQILPAERADAKS